MLLNEQTAPHIIQCTQQRSLFNLQFMKQPFVNNVLHLSLERKLLIAALLSKAYGVIYL